LARGPKSAVCAFSVKLQPRKSFASEAARDPEAIQELVAGQQWRSDLSESVSSALGQGSVHKHDGTTVFAT